jgi:hypothetical protein
MMNRKPRSLRIVRNECARLVTRAVVGYEKLEIADGLFAITLQDGV